MRVPPPPSRTPAPGDDDDATVILPRRGPVARARRPRPWLLGGAALVAALAAAWLWLAPSPPIRPPPAPTPVVVAPQAPAAPAPAPAPLAVAPPAPPVVAPAAPEVLPLKTADEATILANLPEQLTGFRFAPEPLVVVLDFPSLEQQGRMLNRVAALVEKAGLPRDRVLNDAELDAAIRVHGDTVATFYYGHDYPPAALARFFALADRDHVALDPPEEKLRALLRQLGWLAPPPPGTTAPGALISLSRQGADPDITPAVRAAILHHELSHGAFFAEPAYADYVRRFWRTALTPAERDSVRTFLGSEDYDTGDEELMLNEMQAYLMFTYDPHFFLPTNIGMTAARRAALQAAFRADLPVGWPREAMTTAGVGFAPAATAATAERRVVSSPSAQRPPAAASH
jgi:hypothetical protein